MTDTTNVRAYAEPERKKVRRVALAVIVCGFAACVLVALIGFTSIFLVNFIGQVFLDGASLSIANPDRGGFVQGLAIAGFASAFNWVFAYFTIPAAIIALSTSIGRFPKRRILNTNAYLRWGAIWGAILVAAPSLFGVFMMTSPSGSVELTTLLGALLGAFGVGALAGLACAGLFLLIVRPKTQLGEIDTGVF